MMLAAAITMMLCGCSSEEMLSGIASESKTVPISVTDAGFVSAVGDKTRTAESGTTTTFTNGDAIGIYVTDGSTVKYTNLKYTYDETNKVWTNTTYGANVPFVAGGKYFAYYPYRDTYTEATSTTDVTAKATTAETFFAPIITAWTPATDQSTQANYTAQDLMVAQGAANTNGYAFSLVHQMAMVEMDFAQVRYFYDGGVRDKYSFDTYTPYHIGEGQYRILVKPNDATMSMNGKISNASVAIGNWSFAETSPAKAVTKVYQLNNEAASEKTGSYSGIAVGQLYYSDGTYSSTYDENKIPIGIIVSTNSDYCELSSGYGHGLVMALHDATPINTGVSWTNSTIDGNLLKNNTNLKMCYEDVSGLTNTKTIFNKYASTFEKDYPAFYDAYIDYNTNYMSPRLSCSGWFLPSIGQFWDVTEQIANKYSITWKLALCHNENTTSVYRDDNTILTIFGKINELMGGYQNLSYGQIQENHAIYWSSSYSSGWAYCMSFYAPTGGILQSWATDRWFSVRPFLAF